MASSEYHSAQVKRGGEILATQDSAILGRPPSEDDFGQMLREYE